MFTFIKNQKLYILNATSGEIFRIGLGLDGYPYVVKEKIIRFKSEVEEILIERKATIVED